MKKKIVPSLLYIGCAAFIVLWWALSFVNRPMAPVPLHQTAERRTAAAGTPICPLDREDIRRALHGDVATMVRLVGEWDTDAELLIKSGVSGSRRLSREDFCNLQLIGRCLLYGSHPQIERLSDSLRLRDVADDLGEGVDLSRRRSRFLPQTFVAASFLMALTAPENIVALPRGMRKQRHLYSATLMDAIALDADRYSSEEIALQRPDMAFIAHYSHPATVQSLRNQGVELFTISSIDSVEDILHSLRRIGSVIGRPLHAELLALFVEAALVAIDNHLLALQGSFGEDSVIHRPLYVTYGTGFAVPARKTLTGQLLARMGINRSLSLSREEGAAWHRSVDNEHIVNYNPDCIIVSCTERESVFKALLASSALKDVPAVREGRIFFVDEDAQNSPSQYLVLAYYDLFSALVNGGRP